MEKVVSELENVNKLLILSTFIKFKLSLLRNIGITMKLRFPDVFSCRNTVK